MLQTRKSSPWVFTANYSRTFRLADLPFPVGALDPAYIARSQQNAIRRLDVTLLRPILDKHLVTGEPWWGAHVREDERTPGGHGTGLVRYPSLAALDGQPVLLSRRPLATA